MTSTDLISPVPMADRALQNRSAWLLDGFSGVALIVFVAATLLLPIALSVPT